MWPYDYLNQYSNIEIDYKIGQYKSVFWAISSKGNYKNIKGKFKKYIKNTQLKFGNEKIFLKAVIGNEVKGNIRTRILDNIIKATFVVCDITPDGYDKNGCLIFNENVMWELGIAMAWKTEEQVIILCNDKRREEVINTGLPFDIKTDSIQPIDKNYKNIQNIIKVHWEGFEEKRDILIKNIKSKLDGQSLRFLHDKHGTVFTEGDTDINTVRNLLGLCIISAKVYPGKTITYGYVLTRIGRILLNKEFGIKLYPDIVLDMFLAQFSGGYSKEAKDFKRLYGKKWSECISIVSEFIPSGCKKAIERKLDRQCREFDYVYHYFDDYKFDYIMEETINKIGKSKRSLAEFFKSCA